jgi:hypothetical protein
VTSVLPVHKEHWNCDGDCSCVGGSGFLSKPRDKPRVFVVVSSGAFVVH